MNQDLENLRQRLIREAKARRRVYYGDIAGIVHLDMGRPPDRNKIAQVLGEISMYEHEHHRPMLTVIVVRKRDGTPGPGFFTLAQDLGRYSGNDDQAARRFLDAETERVWDYWSHNVETPAR